MTRLFILVMVSALFAGISCTGNHCASTDILGNIFAEEAFAPDAPYFFYNPANPLHPGQWNLVHQAPGSIHYPQSTAPNGHQTAEVTIVNAGLDANILRVWQAGYTGRGIIIGILDDGVEFGHPDLDIVTALSTGMDSKGIVAGQTGAHRKDSDSHGTTVAGMAAANRQLFTQAAGNCRATEQQDVNIDMESTCPYVIAVAALGSNRRYALYTKVS